MKFEAPVTLDDFPDMSQTVEVILDTFHLDHQLAVLIDSQCLVFQAFCCHLNLRQLANLGQYGIVGWGCLTLDGGHLQLRIHLGEQRGHHVMKSVEHAQRYHQGHRSYGNSYDGDAADDVDGMSRLLGEEVASCDVKREVHTDGSKLFTFTFKELVNTVDIVQ